MAKSEYNDKKSEANIWFEPRFGKNGIFATVCIPEGVENTKVYIDDDGNLIVNFIIPGPIVTEDGEVLITNDEREIQYS